MSGVAVAESGLDRSFREFWERHGAVLTTVLSAVLAIAAWQAGARGWSAMEIPLYVAAYGIGGYRKAWEGLQTLIQERDLDVDLLMVIAASGVSAVRPRTVFSLAFATAAIDAMLKRSAVILENSV